MTSATGCALLSAGGIGVRTQSGSGDNLYFVLQEIFTVSLLETVNFPAFFTGVFIMKCTEANRSFKELFKVNCSADLCIRVMTDLSEEDKSHLDIPDENFVFTDILKDILNFLGNPETDYLYIFGSSGSGKTRTVRETAARLNWPCISVTGSKELNLASLIGYTCIRDGQSVFVEGPLTTAMKNGYIFLLNDLDLIDPLVINGIMDVLDNRRLINPCGGMISANRLFRFIATGNSCETGGCENQDGVKTLNASLLDRFIICRMTPLNDHDEYSLLRRMFPKLSLSDVAVMTMTAQKIRIYSNPKYENRLLQNSMSTRTLHRWARLYLTYRRAENPFEFSLFRAYLWRIPQNEQRIVCGYLRQMINEVYEPENLDS